MINIYKKKSVHKCKYVGFLYESQWQTGEYTRSLPSTYDDKFNSI